MPERKAIHYGKVELIPGIICDGYVLDDGTAVLSERGTADLLGIHHKSLQNMAATWPQKTLKPFIDKDLNMAATWVKVVAEKSHFRGRRIAVYKCEVIEAVIRAYVMAMGHNALQKNQIHIARRCALLLCSLVRTALEAAIREACGVAVKIQEAAQQHYMTAVELLEKHGFQCSLPEKKIATKKDILKFLQVPEGTLNSFLMKYRHEIPPIKLDTATIRSLGSSARRMYGYALEDTVQIVFWMDTPRSSELKEEMFGQAGIYAKPAKEEIRWWAILSQVFAGMGFHHNPTIGNYRVDYLVEKLRLILECNGYDGHKYYDTQAERDREEFLLQQYTIIRFHYQTPWETLVNAILQARPNTVVRLYEIEQARHSSK